MCSKENIDLEEEQSPRGGFLKRQMISMSIEYRLINIILYQSLRDAKGMGVMDMHVKRIDLNELKPNFDWSWNDGRYFFQLI